MDTNTVNDIRALKGLVAEPVVWWPWAVALGVVLLGVLAWWLWRRYRRPKVPAPAVIVALPPYAVALEALAQLRQQNLPAEPFYTRLSDIVRQYIEGQFSLHAPERTTEEFLAQASLPAAQMQLLGAFLAEADLVKFARHQPTAADQDRAFAAAQKFVEDTRVAAEVTRRGAAAGLGEAAR